MSEQVSEQPPQQMESGKILQSVEGSIGWLTFHNPERRNAMSLEMWRAASEALDRLAADDAVRVILLRGAGEKAFVSGADISKFEKERDSRDSVEVYNAAVDRFLNALMDCSKPTVAMIRGYCIGGGVGIAVSCDLRICGAGARFGVPAAKLGLGYGVDNIRRLMAVVGPQFASEMLFTARQFDAVEAQRMGLVNQVHADAELEAATQQLAGRIGENAPLTIRAAKAIVRDLQRDPSERNPEACERLVRDCFESEDYQEGRRAFLEKRKPEFKGQ